MHLPCLACFSLSEHQRASSVPEARRSEIAVLREVRAVGAGADHPERGGDAPSRPQWVGAGPRGMALPHALG